MRSIELNCLRMINSVGRKSLNIYTIVALNTTAVKPFGRNTNLSDVTDIPTSIHSQLQSPDTWYHYSTTSSQSPYQL
jgi:hypothetical protein